MNFKNIYVLLWILLLPLGTFTCQPGGKFCGNCVRKISKKDLHVGPNRNQQNRHDEWELLKAKKSQKAAGSTVKAELASYVALAKLLDQITPTMSACGNSYSLSARAYSNHPVKAVILCGLLLIRPVAGIARDNFDSDDYNFGFDDCDSHQRMINFNRQDFRKTLKVLI